MEDSSLIARKLAQNPRTLFASPSYIKKHGKPTHPDEILDHEIISFRNVLSLDFETKIFDISSAISFEMYFLSIFVEIYFGISG